ncbi:MAG: DUF368 domain-containing protein, partial [Bacillota bacterium]
MMCVVRKRGAGIYMRFLIKLLKGALIGISVVIPGVSGGSMAMSMGIYDQLIDFVTDR